MAILRAAVNLRDGKAGWQGGRERAQGFAEVVAADLRLIKVNKPFSLLLSWRLKAEIHGCINYPAGKDRGAKEEEARRDGATGGWQGRGVEWRAATPL